MLGLLRKEFLGHRFSGLNLISTTAAAQGIAILEDAYDLGLKALGHHDWSHQLASNPSLTRKVPLGIRLSHQNAAWHVQDETDWLTLLGTPQVPASSVFELLEHGSLASDTFLLVTGNRSIVGEHTGSSSFNPYLRTSPSRLPLVRVGHYKVCFDYRIIETGANGFEVLFLSPTGASKNQWVLPLRINGHTGESGHSCLEAQLLDFSDYEIRWNVISTGVIAIDNVVITDLRSGRILAEEDFETWWSEDFNR